MTARFGSHEARALPARYDGGPQTPAQFVDQLIWFARLQDAPAAHDRDTRAQLGDVIDDGVERMTTTSSPISTSRFWNRRRWPGPDRLSAHRRSAVSGYRAGLARCRSAASCRRRTYRRCADVRPRGWSG